MWRLMNAPESSDPTASARVDALVAAGQWAEAAAAASAAGLHARATALHEKLWDFAAAAASARAGGDAEAELRNLLDGKRDDLAEIRRPHGDR